MDQKKSIVEDFKEESQAEFEDKIQSQLNKIENLKQKIDEKRQEINTFSKKRTYFFEKDKRRNQSLKSKVTAKQDQLTSVKEKRLSVSSDYKKQLFNIAGVEKSEIYSQIQESYFNYRKKEVSDERTSTENFTQVNIEKIAKRYIDSALHRFKRPFCPERGIDNINFPNENCMYKVLDKEDVHLQLLEKEIGVDLTLHPDRKFLNVSSFDPVRRELTRITLYRLMKEKKVNEDTIKRVLTNSKKSLFKKIRYDGISLAKELSLKGLHPEIIKMMGSLRYRYSFTQNQHFHCAEVGWLCGLIASELNLDTLTARRIGMLHDIGKSMDHSIDGGHAVIGADFIEKHDEAENVVHAVRAHHFDEQPSTDLAYLVIASDALSGARPGARRSTVESYAQKMSDLLRIGQNFEGVKDTYILSAGRELRIIVDSQKLTDQNALDLTSKISTKIEEEMAYPGQIKVTVVRRTSSVQYAK